MNNPSCNFCKESDEVFSVWIAYDKPKGDGIENETHWERFYKMVSCIKCMRKLIIVHEDHPNAE